MTTNYTTLTNLYGATQTNPIGFASHTHETVDYSRGMIPLGHPDLISIDRLRLITEAGYPLYDISYCFGTMSDGAHVRVDLGDSQLEKRNIKHQLILLARGAKVSAKKLGLLDEGNWSICR